MAGFNTAVTGLSAASTSLDVIGNNIANASTTGFKSSRTEFADLYTTAVVGAGSSNVAGAGVTVSDIAQDFSAGTIEFTNNNLDLAIDGSGFFQLADENGSLYYTRAGEFELDDEGYIVSKDGKYVQGYGVADPTADTVSLTPVGNLQVNETESPPKSTTSIDLSFNIDSALDAPENEYDRSDSTSYSFSTTVGIYDSLGNQQTIKYNLVEQDSTIETHLIDAAAITDSTDLSISGYSIGSETLDATVPEVFDAADPTNYGVFALNAETGDIELNSTELQALQEQDSRIARVVYNSTTGDYTVELKAQYTDSGDLYVSSGGDDIQATVSERSSAEVQAWNIVATTGGNGTSFSIGGVTISFEDDASADEIGEAIEDAASDILEQNPEIESVEYDDVNDQLIVTYKPEEGDIDADLLQVAVSAGSDSPFSGAVNGDGIYEPDTSQNGDDSYEGVYRMYAYLNDEELLDIGKVQEPGSGAAEGATEEGAILVTFDTTSGKLETVNGESVSSSGQAPSLTIKGADPADPDTEITLDLSDTSQYSSDSIVKSSQQDGYPKGDLVGVTFAETGEMIASFSNGQSLTLGVIAVATFDNQAGLTPSGSTQWIASLNSGDPILNPPGTGLNGTLKSAALEASNVDLSAELVELIQAQRDYQANSKTLETMNTVTQTILQI
ncbi:Flagellar hook protein FlgE [Marinobacterium lacunae]|uniref:Flagellar hook protein FlgE n=1 Tax=Marinobacterium lacunae TaxID=1232683 RepID=A0A081G0M3_9GAMM|nr:flagellar hook-basal body complex protein [Marinobacterium lacunae]KEA64328.1 Flagellar hook protein FlgE [Marinobacterium lacunae]